MLATGVLGAADDPWIRWDWISTHIPVIRDALAQHIELTFVAVGVGLMIAAPLSLVVWRRRILRGPIYSVTGVLYTIPSLALFALLVPFTGLSFLTAEIGLVSYTLLILIRNIVVGLDAIPPEVREAARGMGFRPAAELLRIDIPLAIPAAMAGLRIATVTTIGLVTITALIGKGGLGSLINDGLIRDFKTPLMVGTALSIALAIVADVSLTGVQRLVTPWAGGRTRA